jgi:hypothetical protein
MATKTFKRATQDTVDAVELFAALPHPNPRRYR